MKRPQWDGWRKVWVVLKIKPMVASQLAGPHSAAGVLRTQFYLKQKIRKGQKGGSQTRFIPFGVESPQHLPSQEHAPSCWVTDGQAGLQEQCHAAWLHVSNKHSGPPVRTYNHLRRQVPISGPQKSLLTSIFPSLCAPPHIKHNVLYTVRAQ